MAVFDSELIKTLTTARHIVVFSGAGVSAESGIPTFRDVLTGLWERFDPQQLATPQAFASDPELVWGWYEWRRGLVLRCQPNPAHHAIAALQRHVAKVSVVTQNVDDLHERAGSDDVVHLHGSLHQPRCSACQAPYRLPSEAPAEPEGGRRLTPPSCLQCGGPVRPGVVWFGEALPAEPWERAQQAALSCDVLLSVGTSSQVYPAAELPRIAASAGACVIQVNPDVTGLEAHLAYALQGAAGEILPRLLAAFPAQAARR